MAERKPIAHKEDVLRRPGAKPGQGKPGTPPPGGKPAPAPAKPGSAPPKPPAQGQPKPPAQGQPKPPAPGQPAPQGQAKPAPPSAAGKAAEAAVDESEVDALAQKLSAMSQGAEQDREAVKAVDERYKTLEERIKKLQMLSELLSVRYNPFLDETEGKVFDGEANDLERFLPGAKPKAAPAPPPATEVVRPYADEPAPDAGRSAPPTASQPAMPRPEPPRPEPPRPEPRPETPPAPPMPAEPVAPPAPPREVIEPELEDYEIFIDEEDPEVQQAMRDALEQQREQPRPRNPRFENRLPAIPRPAEPAVPEGRHTANESYMVMRWMTRLVDNTEPAAIHLFLDYYRYVGWIDDATHIWFRALARGLAEPVPDADWSTFGLDPSLLVERHMMSLRFFDMFQRNAMQPLEMRRVDRMLERALDGEEDGV